MLSESDDLGDRADDYERRLAEAGSTEGIIGGLVKGAEQNKRTIRWLTISLVLDIILSILLGFLGAFAYYNNRTIAADSILACNQSVRNSFAINAFINQQIDNTRLSTTLTPKEIQDRVVAYERLLIVIPEC